MILELCPCLSCIVNELSKLFSDKTSKPNKDVLEESERVSLRKHNYMAQQLQLKQQNQINEAIEAEAQRIYEGLIVTNQQASEADLLSISGQYDPISLGEVELNIPEYGPHYHLLKQKVHNAWEFLDVRFDCTQIKCKENLAEEMVKKQNSFQMKLWKKPGNAYVFQYELPCSYQFYSQLSDKQIQPGSRNRFIKEFKTIQQLQHNLSFRYICFERMGMLESRSFTYLKYTQPSSVDPCAFWEVCVSQDSDEKMTIPTSSLSSKPGKIFSVSYIKQEKKVEEGIIGIRIKTYISLEINVSMDKVWDRIITDSRSYIKEKSQQIRRSSRQFI